MDWTEFDTDGQATIMLSLLTRHGRATPLMWLTVDTATLKNHRNEYEYRCWFASLKPCQRTSGLCIVADRGFGDQKLYQVLTEELKFDYVDPFPRQHRGDRRRTAKCAPLLAWVGPGGRARILRGALVTAERYQVGTVLCVQDKDAMKQACCLQPTSSTVATARAYDEPLRQALGHRVWVPRHQGSAFRHGLGIIHVSTPGRRDRLWLLNALAIALLTLLGAAGEALGYDRYLKSNTSKQRTHSLFRQGCMLYDLIPTMPDLRLLPLIEQFAAILAQLPVFADAFGAV